jgi:hypothetical protein
MHKAGHILSVRVGTASVPETVKTVDAATATATRSPLCTQMDNHLHSEIRKQPYMTTVDCCHHETSDVADQKLHQRLQ